MDWFKGKSTPETIGVFTIKLIGPSGFNFPIIQFYASWCVGCAAYVYIYIYMYIYVYVSDYVAHIRLSDLWLSLTDTTYTFSNFVKENQSMYLTY